MSEVFSAYLQRADALKPFYAGFPEDLLAVPPEGQPWAKQLTSTINTYQAEIGATAKAEGSEAVIITGQQPGIFTGPLYTIYKAVTAISLARRLEDKFGVRCAPIFWIGADDHDFDEARTVHVLTKNNEPLSLTYEPSADVDGKSMYAVPVEDSLHEVVDRIAAETPGSEFREEVRTFLHDSLNDSTSIADWFARIMAHLFRDTPLLFFAPHLPKARAMMAPIIESEINEPLASTKYLNEAAAQLRKLGYEPQLEKGEKECNFFLESDGRRRKVTFNASEFVLPEEERHYATKDLLKQLEDEPGRFSPNVALRCIVQQMLFPAASYVAGPGEVAYWGQLKPVFQHFQVPMPIVFPRARAVLTTIKLNKILHKLGLSIEELSQSTDELVERALQSTSKNPALDIIREKRSDVISAVDAFLAEVRSRDKHAGDMAAGLKSEMQKRINELEKNLVRGDESQAQAVRQQVERVCNALAPFRKPQERVYSIVSFLFQEGWELIPRLLNDLDVETFDLQEVEL